MAKKNYCDLFDDIRKTNILHHGYWHAIPTFVTFTERDRNCTVPRHFKYLKTESIAIQNIQTTEGLMDDLGRIERNRDNNFNDLVNYNQYSINRNKEN